MKSAWILVTSGVVALAGCGGGGGANDNPVLNVPPSSSVSTGPSVSTTVPAADARLLARVRAAHPGCPVQVVRADQKVASFRVICPGAVTTDNFDPATGARLALGDALQGAYLSALSSAAVTQLIAGGASPAAAKSAAPPTPAAFSAWAVGPGDLEVTFAAHSGALTVDFPASSLTPYLRPSGPLAG